MFQTFYFRCMPYFTCVDYIYLNEIYDIPKKHHQLFIYKEEPGTTITPPKPFEGEVNKIPTMFVERMFLPWIQENVQVVSQISRIDVWNQKGQEQDNIIISREGFKNILSYVDF